MENYNSNEFAATLDLSPIDGNSFIASLNNNNHHHICVEKASIRNIWAMEIADHVAQSLDNTAITLVTELPEDFKFTDPLAALQQDDIVSNINILTSN